jgi:hypothetical protein
MEMHSGCYNTKVGRIWKGGKAGTIRSVQGSKRAGESPALQGWPAAATTTQLAHIAGGRLARQASQTLCSKACRHALPQTCMGWQPSLTAVPFKPQHRAKAGHITKEKAGHRGLVQPARLVQMQACHAAAGKTGSRGLLALTTQPYSPAGSHTAPSSPHSPPGELLCLLRLLLLPLGTQLQAHLLARGVQAVLADAASSFAPCTRHSPRVACLSTLRVFYFCTAMSPKGLTYAGRRAHCHLGCSNPITSSGQWAIACFLAEGARRGVQRGHRQLNPGA